MTARKFLLVLLLIALPAWAISTEQEVQIGHRASTQFEQKYGLVQDIAMQERVTRIGQRLAVHSGRNDVRYIFKVANMEQFNALAFPGGFIYTTSGLMRALNDGELAFVLGHEVTHVARRHSVKQLEKAQYTQVGLAAILAAMGNGRVQDNSVTLARLAGAVMSSQWSQADERESDEIGIQMMAKAGYDPAFAVSALSKLAKQSGGTPGFLNTLVGSHPLPQDRIRDAVSAVPSVPYQANTQAPAPVAAAPPPGSSQPEIDNGWQQDLFESIKEADTGLNGDAALMNEARRRATSQQQSGQIASGYLLSFKIPAPASSTQAESLLLGDHLPRLLSQARYQSYGLAVARWPNGNRQVVVILR